MKSFHLIIYFVKHNKFIELLQSVLYFTNMKYIWTHVGLGFSDSDEYFSAEMKGLKMMPIPDLKQFPRGVEKYIVPLSKTKLNKVQGLFDVWLNTPYDMYIYGIWALNVMTIFLAPSLFTIGIISIKVMYWLVVILIILYFPVRLWLKKKSKYSQACAEISSRILFELGIDFLLNGKFEIASPHIMRMMVIFAKWKIYQRGII